jgi:hypothetical protein
VQIAAGEAGFLLTGTTVELHNAGSTPASVLWVLFDAAATFTETKGVTRVGPVDARRTGDLRPSGLGVARNLSGTPLDIYVLTIAPASPSPGTPTSATPGP